MACRYVLTIFAGEDDTIHPDRVAELLRDAKVLGGEGNPIDYVPPGMNDCGDPWGLSITIAAEVPSGRP